MNKKVKLFELADKKFINVAKGKNLPKNYRDKGDFPVIAAGKSIAYFSSHANYNTNTITISSSGANAGFVWKHTYPIWASDCTVIEVNENINLDYFYLFLLSKQEIIYSFQTGAGQPHVYWKDIKNIEIDLPSLEKQRKIAKTLDKANELIELRKESIIKLDALAKSIFIDMFGDPVSNPKGWEVKKLKELTDVKTGKTPSRNEPLYWENGTELWATTTEVNKRFIFDTQEKITKYAVEKCNLTIYPKNTILIAMYGQGKTRGNVVLLKVDSTINQAFGAILSSENINQEFLLSLLKNSYSHIRSLGRGGNQENLNLDIVKNLDIIYPSIDLQNKFAKIIEKIEEQKSLYEKELELLQNNFDALLQKSFQE